jgi:hypothetical protein
MDEFQSELRAVCGGKLSGPSRATKPVEPMIDVRRESSETSKETAIGTGATRAADGIEMSKPPVPAFRPETSEKKGAAAKPNSPDKTTLETPTPVVETATSISSAVAGSKQDQTSTSAKVAPEVEGEENKDADISTITNAVLARSHPLANAFPIMSEPELRAMAADIALKGLQNAIVMLAGMILDGRNREIACRLAGVEPKYVEFGSLGGTISPVDWVISQGVQRRHLTVGQRSMIGAQLMPELEEEAKNRQGARTDLQPESETEWGRSAERASAAVGVSTDSIKAALKVLKTGIPDVQAAVKSGKITLNAGVRLAELPADEQRRAYTGDAKTTIAALRNTKPPQEGRDNVLADHPELESQLRAKIKNDPEIGKDALEKSAADLVTADQRRLAENKNTGKPESRMPAKNQDFDNAVKEVQPDLESASREVQAELLDGRLTLCFPFARTADHIANSLRDLEPDLKARFNALLAADEPLQIEVHGPQEGE